MSDEHDFSANKIFAYLFLYTALEVAWGTAFDFPRWAIWSGLLFFALLKGYLIFAWFMHMKFEGWIVKGLVAPTIPLAAIAVFANMPDTSFNEDLLYPIGSQLEVELRPFNEEMDPDDEDNFYILRSTGEVTGMPDQTPGKVKPHDAASDEESGH